MAISFNSSCIQCGESDPRVLEFHHRDSDQKYKDIAKMVGEGLSAGRLQQEMDKCDVLCGNCHKKLTMKEDTGGVKNNLKL